MLIFFVVVVSVFGGILLAGLGVFCFQFYRSLQRLTTVAETVYGVLKPLSQDKLLPEFLIAMRKLTAQGGEIVKGVEALTRMAKVFNQVAWQAGLFEAPTAPAAPVGIPPAFDEAKTDFIAPTEEDMAIREEQEELRKRGIETAVENMVEPDMAAMNGANV